MSSALTDSAFRYHTTFGVEKKVITADDKLSLNNVIHQEFSIGSSPVLVQSSDSQFDDWVNVNVQWWYSPCAADGNDNDNDKRLGLTAKADQPDHKKIQYTKNKNGQRSSAKVTHELSQNVE